MFDLVHKYKRFIQVFLFLIALTFATWGIESYTQFRGARDEIASVNGLPITQREFEEELRAQQEQMRRVFGRSVDPALFDTPETRQALLDQIVNRRLVASAVSKAHLAVPDEVLAEAIHSIPAFQVGGRFSKESYEAVLRSQNPPLTPAQFEARLRFDLAIQQLTQAVGESAFASREVAARLAALENQKREFMQAAIRAEDFLPQVKVDDEKAKAHYEANQADFRTPERIRAEYVMLSAEALARQDPATEAEIKAAYDARASAFTVGEQRRASHILVKTKEEADRIAEALRKAPGSFAELAKKNSQDPGSAEKGGDLGWFGRGMMVRPFEDAVFGMKEGQTSDPVQSEFGFHVIRLTGVQGGKSRSLQEVRKELADEITRQKGQKRFAEAAEGFTNMVYEQADNLKSVAEKYKLTVQTSGWIARGGRQELGALDHPKLAGALFSADAIQSRRNTDAVEVAPSTMVAARVIEHQPAAQRSFEEVKGEIVDLLRRRAAAELAHKDGAAKLQALQKGENPAGIKWGPARSASRREPGNVPGEVLRPVVTADVSKLPAHVGIPVPETGYMLVRITKVTEGGAGNPAEASLRAGQIYGQAQFQAYLASLKSAADISVRKSALEKK